LKAIKLADLSVFSAVERNPTDKTRAKFVKFAERLSEQGALEVILNAMELDNIKSTIEFFGDGVTKGRANQIAKSLIMYLAIEERVFV
jgi:imidazole glycerol phosphate synthase subunit HisF